MRTSILGLGNNLRFYLCLMPVSMNKGVEGLRAFVQENLGQDPMNGDVYIFVSRSHKLIKLLHYNRNVFTLYTRKIYHGSFVYPQCVNGEEGSVEMEWSRLYALVSGYSYNKRYYY